MSVEVEDVLVSRGRMRILGVLSTVECLSANEIRNRVRLGVAAVYCHLRALVAADILVKKAVGNARLYGFNEDSARAIKIRQFIVAYNLAQQ